MTKEPSTIEVIYDGECPICNHFACALKDSTNVKTINAREGSTRLEQAEQVNLDIDRGLIVYTQQKFYYGAEALQFVANNTQASGALGFLNQYLLRHRKIAKALYPFGVFTRRVLLLILRRPLIRNSDQYPRANEDTKSITVYYNSACPVCKAGVEYQQGKTLACAIAWSDVHQNNQSAVETGNTIELVRERLHAKDDAGVVHIGIDAFIAIWRLSLAERWKAKLFSLPIIHGVSQLCYNVFARLLYKWNRYKNHW